MPGDADLIIRFAGTAGEGVLTVGDLPGPDYRPNGPPRPRHCPL